MCIRDRRYVDLGSPDLIAGKADGAENVIRVKATVRNFPNETNMSVITEAGSFYTFNVKYAAEPLLLNVEMCDFIQDVYKRQLLLTLWKSEEDKVTKTESGELGSAVTAYIERIQSDRSIVPSFNTFYEYMRCLLYTSYPQLHRPKRTPPHRNHLLCNP